MTRRIHSLYSLRHGYRLDTRNWLSSTSGDFIRKGCSSSPRLSLTCAKGRPVAHKYLHSYARTSNGLPQCSHPNCFESYRSIRLAHSAVAFKHTDRSPSNSNYQNSEIRRTSSQDNTLDAQENRYASHLDEVFPPLKFPPELARRLMTHGSHKAAVDGHNARFSFIGRRVLEAFFMLFLHSSNAGQDSGHDFDQVTSLTLNTYVLGEHVSPKWKLGRVLRWVPTVGGNYTPKESEGLAAEARRRSMRDGALLQGPNGVDYGLDILKSVGLYKVHGEAVQAVVGGVYHQFGGSVAHRLFHTRILPHILLPGIPKGLHDSFHEDALRTLASMGGPESNLLEKLGLTARKETHNTPEEALEQPFGSSNHNIRIPITN